MTRKERAALERDAARYRFLREHDHFCYDLLESLRDAGYPELDIWQADLDEQIDSAIKAMKSSP